jgi:hypothetical protein
MFGFINDCSGHWGAREWKVGRLDRGVGPERQHEAAIRVIIHAFCLPLVLRDLFGTIFARS